MASTHTPSYLAKCAALRRGGVCLPILPGVTVGRGFADLGYEEFYVLEDGMFCSLLTGERSKMEHDSVESVFAIPDSTQLLDHLLRKKVSIEKLEFVDHRRWKLELQLSHGERREFQSSHLDEVLILGVLSFYEIEFAPQSPRNLITTKEP